MRRLRAQYPDELVVIGVHSAKFPAEKETANIRAAVMRHGITHPVINDAEFQVWSSYGVRAWPTLMLIDPGGKVVGYEAGELDPARLAPVLDEMIAEFDGRGLLNRAPIPGLLPAADVESTLLRYPSKLLLAPDGRLFAADTGHHRILEVNLSEDGLSGEIVRIFGTGEAGFADGSIGRALFHNPHGLAFVQRENGSTLYVADTENHAVRAVDLVRQQVRTVAGTGEMGRGLQAGGGKLTEISLRSPWALAPLQNALFVAMAGSHQIWLIVDTMETGDEAQIGVFAGTGAEALQDGPRAETAFNQPSDLALALGHLFVADSEASAIRAITLDDDIRVMTLVGQGLFDFGDVDGVGPAVRLQHPTGLATDGRLLYIADSYNHKIKTLDPTTGEVRTLIGTGMPGSTDGTFARAQLYEPEGVAVNGDLLYIA
ncbi:MAG: alkyl hydroperoxide reductase, partial [Hyphomicrobiaceae bacterium]